MTGPGRGSCGTSSGGRNGIFYATITTIDSAGRIVVPKREELGFRPGQKLELSAVDGRLEVEVTYL